MADIGNIVNLYANVNLEIPEGESFKVYKVLDSDLRDNDIVTISHKLKEIVLNVLKQSKFKLMFRFSRINVGPVVEVLFYYLGPSKNFIKLLRELGQSLSDATGEMSVTGEEKGVIFFLGEFELREKLTKDISYTIEYNEPFRSEDTGFYNSVERIHTMELGPDATMKTLIDKLLEERKISRKHLTFKAYNKSNEEINNFQTKLRTCCHDGFIRLEISEKSNSSRSPRPSGPESLKSPKIKPSSVLQKVDLSLLNNKKSSAKNNNYSVKEIKEFLRERGLLQTGNKEELIARLREYEGSS